MTHRLGQPEGIQYQFHPKAQTAFILPTENLHVISPPPTPATPPDISQRRNTAVTCQPRAPTGKHESRLAAARHHGRQTTATMLSRYPPSSPEHAPADTPRVYGERFSGAPSSSVVSGGGRAAAIGRGAGRERSNGGYSQRPFRTRHRHRRPLGCRVSPAVRRRVVVAVGCTAAAAAEAVVSCAGNGFRRRPLVVILLLAR